MKCPKCYSENLYQVNTEQCLCRNCEHIFKADQPIVSKPSEKSTKLQSIVTKFTVKQYALASLVILLTVGGTIRFVLSKRDPYLCSKNQREQIIAKLDPLIQDWDDANNLAGSTSRINLAVPVSKLQSVQKEVRTLQIPDCAKPLTEKFLRMTDTTIESYLVFMQNESDSIVNAKIISARASQDNFITYYSRFQKGESLDPVLVTEEILKKGEKLLDEMEQLENTNN